MAEVVLNEVVKTYGDIYAVNHVSLTVADGEFVALVGPSGCGKTTTLSLIAGLNEISGGEIHIGGRLVNDLDPKDRDIAMVFQNYALYPNKTVFKNLAFPLQMRKLAKAEIERKVLSAAKVLDITHLLERKPRELSGGQQQRVALGRALVRDPRVFLMDEPLSNLDAKLRVQMRTELKRFHQDLEATVVYVTHDQLEAVTMADKMAVMHGGFLQQYDSPKNVFDNPVNMFVASFVGSPAMSLVPLEAVSHGSDVALRSPEGWELPLSPQNARKALGATSNQVVLGARHSTVKLHSAQTPGAVPGVVYTVEPTGDITFVQVFLGTSVVIVSLDPSVTVHPDQKVWIEFDQDKIHLFDGATELALAAV
ncbi:MAG: ABC transporter ATP-binding protein [Candidatus Kaistia colombiensis]|nr:MAG: ABC transporter ATP-binding protein [Kaistia sp.]